MNINKGKSILVVDDCKDNLLLMELLLQGEGYKVKCATGGTEGLAQINKQSPDLVILDLMMPDMSGLEVVQHLKNKCQMPNVPIMLLTANSDFKHEDIQNFDALCYKPFEIDNILETIRSLFNSSKNSLIPSFKTIDC